MIEKGVKAAEPIRILFVKKKNQNKNKRDRFDDDTSLKGVAASAGNHCCECVHVMTLYLKEIFKLICCVTSPNIELEAQPDNKFGNMFCDLVDITFGFFKDLLNLLRILILCSTERRNT